MLTLSFSSLVLIIIVIFYFRGVVKRTAQASEQILTTAVVQADKEVRYLTKAHDAAIAERLVELKAEIAAKGIDVDAEIASLYKN